MSWDGLINLVFPDTCRVCDQPLTDSSPYPVCGECLNDFSPIDANYWCVGCHTAFVTPYPLDENGFCGLCRRGLRGFDRAAALGFYEGKLRKLIHVFKYGGIPTLARPLANHLVTAIPRDRQFDVIVPVPMHWWRRYRRGYNQAQLLAAEVARCLALPCVEALRRRRRTPPQASLSHRDRRRSLIDAFTITKPELVRDRHALLIDDVFTTGATASACGTVLKGAGAASVTVLTLARVDLRVAVADSQSVVKSSAAGG